ncbi:hypothetical protein AK812_SmicGene48177, partial [Symbiodinium microadriaticum]
SPCPLGTSQPLLGSSVVRRLEWATFPKRLPTSAAPLAN